MTEGLATTLAGEGFFGDSYFLTDALDRVVFKSGALLTIDDLPLCDLTGETFDLTDFTGDSALTLF